MSSLFGSQAPRALLTQLTRLAQRRPDKRRWLGDVLGRRLDKLAAVAVDVAVETGDPIGLMLASSKTMPPSTLQIASESGSKPMPIGSPYRYERSS